LEITMNILEAKLNSIPEDALGPAAPGATAAAAAAPGTAASLFISRQLPPCAACHTCV
jgi:hypothetical protein